MTKKGHHFSEEKI